MKISNHLNIRNGIEGALRLFADLGQIDSLLDVGSGNTDHNLLFNLFCKNIYTNDINEKVKHKNFYGDFMEIDFKQKFQVVYASNVLEHIRNSGSFIEKLFEVCEDDGFVCIAVPRPHLNRLLSGHITTWTTGTLVYNIVSAGFDCSSAKVCNGIYEKTIIVQKRKIDQKGFNLFSGVVDDLSTIAKYFPWPIYHNCRGILPSVNWPDVYTFKSIGYFDSIYCQYISGDTYKVSADASLRILQES